MKKWGRVILFVGFAFLFGGCTKLPQEQFAEQLTNQQAANAGEFQATIDTFEMGNSSDYGQEADRYASMLMSQLVGSSFKGDFVQDKETKAILLNLAVAFGGQELPIKLIVDPEKQEAYVSAEIYETLQGYISAFGSDSYGTKPDAAEYEGKYLRIDQETLDSYFGEGTFAEDGEGTTEAEKEPENLFTMNSLFHNETFADYLKTFEPDAFKRDGDTISHTFTKEELANYADYAQEQGADQKQVAELETMLEEVEQFDLTMTVNTKTNQQKMAFHFVQADELQTTIGATVTFTGKKSDTAVAIPTAEELIDPEELFSPYDYGWDDSYDDGYENDYDDEYWDSYDETDDWSSYMLTDEEFEELLLQIKQELPYLTQAFDPRAVSRACRSTPSDTKFIRHSKGKRPPKLAKKLTLGGRYFFRYDFFRYDFFCDS